MLYKIDLSCALTWGIYIPANQSDFVVFVPIFSSKKGEKSEQYDFYVGRRRRKKISGAGAEYYRYSFLTVKANTRHMLP